MEEKINKLMVDVAEIRKDIQSMVKNHEDNSESLKDHETRIRVLESQQSKTSGMRVIMSLLNNALIGVVVGVVVGLILKYN